MIPLFDILARAQKEVGDHLLNDFLRSSIYVNEPV